jgi:hypothetical protein
VGIIEDSNRFVASNKIPTIEGATSLRDALGKLYEQDAVGFVLSQGGETQGYVSRRQIISNLVGRGSWINIQNETIRTLIDNPTVDLSPIRIAEQSLPVGTQTEGLGSSSGYVIAIGDKGRTVGYVFPEKLIVEIQTPVPFYYCKNPAERHPNATSGGLCNYCPFPVEG